MRLDQPGFPRQRTGPRHRLGVLLAAVLALIVTVLPASPASAVPLPWGPYTCKDGYVWRMATSDDLVCVTPTRRAQIAEENRLSPSRKIGQP